MFCFLFIQCLLASKVWKERHTEYQNSYVNYSHGIIVQIDSTMHLKRHKESLSWFVLGGERKHWYRYMDNQGSRNYWVQQLFAAFKVEATKARETMQIASPSQSPAHTSNKIQQQRNPANQNPASKQPPPRPPPPGSQPINNQDTNQPRKTRSTKLLESCYVLKIEDFTIYQVSTADNKRNAPKKFLASDKKHLHLPSDMSVIHAEYTDYFFPEGIEFPGKFALYEFTINDALLAQYITKHLLRYWPIFARSSTHLFADAVNIRQKIAMHINNLVSSEFPYRSSRRAR